MYNFLLKAKNCICSAPNNNSKVILFDALWMSEPWIVPRAISFHNKIDCLNNILVLRKKAAFYCDCIQGKH
ncbi:hypothetical protein BpHYR1_004839 [Brachionus plicatilis]|uniref:Uncharacterized protein n=1 Tax=Brachionus plicatilis TaxID=10195 RepID=A0A3M7QLS7_BRAPC|nr:hypothetical protein BpHYR1_004839 [Brachionus plicatilis]